MFKKQLGEKLGEGIQKKVYVNKENPEHAIGIFHSPEIYKHYKETPYQVKGRFYLTKIFHLLFPKQIPDMHLASFDPHMIEVDRVKGEGRGWNPTEFRNDKKAFEEAMRLSGAISDLGASIDAGGKNFKYDQEGNLVYVDTVNFFNYGNRDYNPKKIKAALEKLEEDKKAQGLVFLKRLEELYQEQLVSIKDSDKNNK